jgi:hypothetical protein
MARRGGGPIANAFKFGLGAGVGFGLSHMIFLLVGMAFFFPGLIMLSKERKKPAQQKNTTNIYIAYALMAIGCVLGLGLGAGFLFTNALADFGE